MQFVYNDPLPLSGERTKYSIIVDGSQNSFQFTVLPTCSRFKVEISSSDLNLQVPSCSWRQSSPIFNSSPNLRERGLEKSFCLRSVSLEAAVCLFRPVAFVFFCLSRVHSSALHGVLHSPPFGKFSHLDKKSPALRISLSSGPFLAHQAAIVPEEKMVVTVTPGKMEGRVLERGPSPDPFNFLSTYWGSICYSWCLKGTAAGVVSEGRSQITQYRSNARESPVGYLQEKCPSSHISNASVPKCA